MSATKADTPKEKLLSKTRVGNFIYEIVAVTPSSGSPVVSSTSAASVTQKKIFIKPDPSPALALSGFIPQFRQATQLFVDTNIDNIGLVPPVEFEEVVRSNEIDIKPTFHVPPHLLGRNLDDPNGDLINSGRKPQKPRLGVKVPYRNLTSQIVTHDEIAQELIQRSIRNRPAYFHEPNNPAFATKLTQRLATRLTVPSGSDRVGLILKDSRSASKGLVLAPSPFKYLQHTPEVDPLAVTDEKSEEEKEASQKFDRETEKALALKQLRELPTRTYRTKAQQKRDRPTAAEKKMNKVQKLYTKITNKAKANAAEASNTDKQAEVFKSRNEPKEPVKENGEYERIEEQLRLILHEPPEEPEIPPQVEQSPDAVEEMLVVEEHDVVTTQNEDQIDKKPKLGPPKQPLKFRKKRGRNKRELDMLFVDEGAINLLYQAEQEEANSRRSSVDESIMKKPRVTISGGRRQALKAKEKLVKSAILRLGNSQSNQAISTRTRGSTTTMSPKEGNASKTLRRRSDSSTGSALEFVGSSPRHSMADASRIIRRHSSSSEDGSVRSTSPVITVRRKSSPAGKGGVGKAAAAEKKKRTVTMEKKAVDAAEKKAEATNKKKDVATAVTTKKKIMIIRKKDAVGNKKKDNLKYVSKASQKIKGSVAAQQKGKIKPSIMSKLQMEMTKRFKESGDPKLKGSTLEMTILKSVKQRGRSLMSTMPKKTKSKLSVPLHIDTDGKGRKGPQASPAGSKSPASSRVDPNAMSPVSFTEESCNNFLKSLENETASGKSSELKQRGNLRQNEGFSHFKEISVRKADGIAQITLTPASTKLKNSLNCQVLKELLESFNMLKKDESVHVVLFTGTGNTFCQGIDLSCVLHNSAEKRKKAAEELAQAIWDFTKAVAHFPQILVAAVNGAATGIGVTMLPFFDIIYATDKATFYTPYSRIGQVPEAAATVTFPMCIGAKSTSDLLYSCKTLTASEALQCGLVTQVLWPAKFQEELIPRVKNLATQSPQAMEATKALLRHQLRTKLEFTLSGESQLLVQHWCSLECQQAIRLFLESEDLTLQRQRVVGTDT